jgi:dTDP-4-dehydrorhamnose 3,5-epimerase
MATSPELLSFLRNTDERGSFSSPFDRDAVNRLNRSEVYFALSSTSVVHTVRGMHYQIPPFAEAKLVYVVRGSIMDIVIDLDSSLSIDKRIHKFHLSEDVDNCLYIPRGFAHGYQTLSSDVQVMYALDGEYSKSNTRGFSPLSPLLLDMWPSTPVHLKREDLLWPHLV